MMKTDKVKNWRGKKLTLVELQEHTIVLKDKEKCLAVNVKILVFL